MNESENEKKNDTDLSEDGLTDTDDKENALQTDDTDQQDDININEMENEKADSLRENISDENIDAEIEQLNINNDGAESVSPELLDNQENQSARAPRSRISRKPSKSSQQTARDITFNLETLDSLPNGCVPVFLSTLTMDVFKMKVDETISVSQPLKFILKDDILADLVARAAVSDFSVVKNEIKNYDGKELLLVYDGNFKFGQNFILATSEAAKEELGRLIAVIDDEVINASPDQNLQQTMLTGTYQPPSPKKWTNLGSDKEIIEQQVIHNRPLICSIVRRARRAFGAPINFSEKPALKDYVEVSSYEDNAYSVRVLESDKNETNAPCKATTGTNTTWKYPRNSYTQYEPRKLAEEERAVLYSSENMITDSNRALPYIIEAVQHNEITNYFVDDYGCLAPGDTIFDNKTDNDLKEFQTFADLKYGKEKAVTCIEWHPTIKGIIATSMAEKTSFDQRVDNLSKVILTKSYIVLWSFLDPIQPQILLEAPSDLYCFKFNPTDPQYLAGGCYSGQVVLWDMESQLEDLRNVKGRMKSRNVIPLFSFEEDDGPKIPSLRHAAISNCESSHSGPITDIKWLPDHYEINNLGYSLENLSMKCVQLATAAGDNKILFWDIRPNKAVTGAADKISMQIATPVGVPETFKFLDMKWKPTLRVHLYKVGPGGDHAPTKFSLKEVQGDRHVLEGLEEKENKMDDIGTVKSGAPKARTLQAVNTHIYVGTEDGELVYVDWMPQKDSDSGKLQTPKPDFFWNIHDGPITAVTRCPFERSVLLVVGGWVWSLWKEGVNSGPILQSCTSAKPLTGGVWSPTRSSVFFITRADGCVEIWDIIDKTHEPTLVQNISSTAALTTLSIYNFVKKQLVAFGDINGSLHVYEVPVRFKQHSQSEYNDTMKYIDKEVKRRDFVRRRWNLREQEKIEKEVEAKKKAGIAPQVILSDDEVKQRMKTEYDTYLQDEQAFLRELGLKDEEDGPLS